ncbi:hypothetical protein FJQ98_04055 [Lysinibacillus agricola]|uniref:Uncharacterized protein n=1 Tax=Lysinibacillus agricola TaxID=2590012 RepID=A0ABX7ATV1_9BACI|nr:MULTISPECIES: hypothetical protein [Lysinibacillus]QQP13254.1 hypothetical protein FJQ98_04055 [Lysinibacillus agricola]
MFFDESEGNIRPKTNVIFKIQGLKTNTDTFLQPILNQNEHSILGLIITEIEGEIY